MRRSSGRLCGCAATADAEVVRVVDGRLRPQGLPLLVLLLQARTLVAHVQRGRDAFGNHRGYLLHDVVLALVLRSSRVRCWPRQRIAPPPARTPWSSAPRRRGGRALILVATPPTRFKCGHVHAEVHPVHPVDALVTSEPRATCRRLMVSSKRGVGGPGARSSQSLSAIPLTENHSQPNMLALASIGRLNARPRRAGASRQDTLLRSSAFEATLRESSTSGAASLAEMSGRWR